MKTMIGMFLSILFGTMAIGLAQAPKDEASAIRVTSRAFAAGGKIPSKYTCDGANVSPSLHFQNIPKETKSMVVIVDDPDAPGKTFTHWLLWNINLKATEILEDGLPPSAVEGTNDFGKAEYGGPCPPSGVHRYFFRLYALDTTLTLPATSKRAAVDKAMAGHILAEGSVMASYSREK